MLHFSEHAFLHLLIKYLLELNIQNARLCDLKKAS